MVDERRRNADWDYVTRREWEMHLNASSARDRRLEEHMERQDTQLDVIQNNVSRMLGGIAVLVVVGNVVVMMVLR